MCYPLVSRQVVLHVPAPDDLLSLGRARALYSLHEKTFTRLLPVPVVLPVHEITCLMSDDVDYDRQLWPCLSRLVLHLTTTPTSHDRFHPLPPASMTAWRRPSARSLRHSPRGSEPFSTCFLIQHSIFFGSSTHVRVVGRSFHGFISGSEDYSILDFPSHSSNAFLIVVLLYITSAQLSLG